jgi:hypothetical protein
MTAASESEPARALRTALLIDGWPERQSHAAIERLAAVLGDPEVGGWDVSALVDPQAFEIQRALDDFFKGASAGSSLFLYLATDVLPSPGGLFFTTRRSNKDELMSTAVVDGFVSNGMTATAAAEIVIVIDGIGGAGFVEQLGEPVLRAPAVIITSAGAQHEPAGEFALAFADGLEQGEADADGDGYVSITELYDYVSRRVQEASPDQVPEMRLLGVDGPILIARPGPGAAPIADPDLSPSVQHLRRALGTEPVTAYAVAVALMDEHRDYGAGRDRPQLHVRPDATTKPVERWLGEVRALYRPDAVTVLHGRLVLLGLALLDDDLRSALSREGFLRAVEAELRESMSQLLLPAWRPAWQRPDSVPTLSDRPAQVDLLGRRVFAEALATRIRDEHDESTRRRSTEPRRSDATRPASDPKADAFLVHLQGSWGSGKTSLLNLLADELRGSPERWIVVNFNAWQYERIGPPWWGLMQAVLREGVRDPWPPGWSRSAAWWRRLAAGGAADIARGAKLALLDFAWRIRLGWMAYLLLPALGALLWYAAERGWLEPDVREVSDVADAATAAGAILTILVTLVGAVRGLSRSLSVSSARGANAFLASTRDPMRTLKRRFRRLISSLQRPVAIFIDDLDRCQATYVVEVLQGIQTLLLDEPVTYVVAADRRWLYDSYAKVYSDFATTVQEPGRPLGYLFLEKTFQLSAPLPRLSPEVRATFWHRLILVDGDQGAEELEEIEAEAAKRFESAASETEVREVLERSRGSSPQAQLAIRSAAIRRLAAPELRRRTEHTLKPFSRLLDPNPRALKRLVNAYGIERDIRLLEGRGGAPDALAPERLALWTIVRLRWPLLADYLTEHPEAVEDGTEPVEADAALKDLLGSDDVRAVIQGRGVGVALTREVIEGLG